MTVYMTRVGGVVCLALALAGCGWFGKDKKGQILVPELATPREQFLFAVRLQEETLVLAKEPAKRARQLGGLKAACQMVVVRFPDDQEYTPLAKLQICELYLTGYKEYKKALDLAEELIRDYGHRDPIDARARYLLGSALERMGRVAEAQQAFKECSDRHGASKDKSVLRSAAMAKDRYMRVVTTDAPAKESKKKR